MPNKAAKGFTLIEMMITIGILAILATIASPSMAPFIAKQRMKTVTQNIADSIQLARSESLANGDTYQLSTIEAGDWSKGWNIEFITTSGNKEVFKRYPININGITVNTTSRTGNKNIVHFNQNARINSMINFEVAHNTLTLDPYCIAVAASGNVQASIGACDVF